MSRAPFLAPYSRHEGGRGRRTDGRPSEPEHPDLYGERAPARTGRGERLAAVAFSVLVVLAIAGLVAAC